MIPANINLNSIGMVELVLLLVAILVVIWIIRAALNR